MRETDLFEPVKRLLEEAGYAVYPEVEGPGGRADMVGIRGPELVAVELKTSLSLDLMEQGLNWTHYANRVWVAVPKPKRYNNFARFVLRKLGLGLIEVEFMDPKRHAQLVKLTGESLPVATAKFDDMCRPCWNRRVLPDLRKALREEQREGPPGGNAGGGYVTEYKLTMKRIKRLLSSRGDEWLTVSDILKDVETHYATPKSSLANALLSFEADWCENKKEGKKLYFRFKRAG